jgi:hypothetical protein
MASSVRRIHRNLKHRTKAMTRPNAERDAWRTFVRLDVSCKQQDRLGNTLNPVLAAPFEHVPRSMPDGLGVPVSDSRWDGAKRCGA